MIGFGFPIWWGYGPREHVSLIIYNPASQKVGTLNAMRIYNCRYQYQIRKGLRNVPTPEEQVLWRFLKHNAIGYKFRRQYGIVKYIVDFYCPEARLVVEVDGGIHTIQKEYDQCRDQFLQSLHIKTIRFSNEDIRTDLAGVIKAIKRECGQRTTPSSIEEGD